MLISSCLEVVGAFSWGEGVDGFGDGVPEVVDRSGGGFSQEGLEFGERLFDGIEVRAVGRQAEHLCSLRLDRFSNAADLVGWEVVHDHHVDGFKDWDQDTAHIDQERLTIHGAVEDHGATSPSRHKPAVKVVVFQ